jgi:hypothetical protein
MRMSGVKMVKKNAYRIVIFIVFTFMFITFQGCSIIQTKNPRVSDIIGNIKGITDLSLMNEGDKSKLRKLYNLNAADLEEFKLYAPKTNMEAGQILILKAKDQSQIEGIKECIDNEIQRQAASFKEYRPDQYSLIENNVLKVKGKYIFLVVSKDVDIIAKSISDSFN